MNEWLIASLLTWVPYIAYIIITYVAVRFIKSKVKDENVQKILSFLNIKVALLLLIVSGLMSFTATSNTPKLDPTPNQTVQQQRFEENVREMSKKEVKKVERIQDSFDERREKILNQFKRD